MNRLPSPPYNAAGKLPNGHERCTVGAIRWIQPAAYTSGVRPSPSPPSPPYRSLSPAERSSIAVPRCGGFGSCRSSPPHPPPSLRSRLPPVDVVVALAALVASPPPQYRCLAVVVAPPPTVASHSPFGLDRVSPLTHPAPFTSRPRLSTSSTAPPPRTLAS